MTETTDANDELTWTQAVLFDCRRANLAMAGEVARLRGRIEQAVAHLEHGDMPEPAARALAILKEAL